LIWNFTFVPTNESGPWEYCRVRVWPAGEDIAPFYKVVLSIEEKDIALGGAGNVEIEAPRTEMMGSKLK
jgi:hypothetical protein